MTGFMKKLILRFAALFTGLALVFTTAFFAANARKAPSSDSILTDVFPSVNKKEGNLTVILDPGHGGMDGGAVGLDGTLEKELNLALAQKAAKLLTLMGYRVVLTRDRDQMLGQGAPGHKKLADLKYRLEMASSYENAVLISIHMNKFPLESCSGIQLYYSANNEQSLLLGRELHRMVGDFQKDNKRELKKADSAIYLLDRTTQPAILMECGFLSNGTECALLQQESYQEKLALLIASAICAYEEQTAPKE
jgi:N-acetylmuramoyl-L-alanine amidase